MACTVKQDENRSLQGMLIAVLVALTITIGNTLIWNFESFAPGSTGAAMSRMIHGSTWLTSVLVASTGFVWGRVAWVTVKAIFSRVHR